MLLCFMLVRAPAALWVYGAQSALPGLSVSTVEGSLWQGQAQGISWQWASRPMGLSRLRWQLKPWSLLLLSPGLELDANLHQQTFQGYLSLPLGQGLRLRDFSMVMPASQLPVPAPLPLSGRVRVDIGRLDIEDQAVSDAEGRVVLEAVQLHAQQSWQLGSFAAELTAQSGDIHARLFDLGGPGQLAGELQLAITGAYRLDTSLGIEDQQATGLAEVLPLLGEPAGQGRVRMQLSGKLW